MRNVNLARIAVTVATALTLFLGGFGIGARPAADAAPAAQIAAAAVEEESGPAREHGGGARSGGHDGAIRPSA